MRELGRRIDREKSKAKKYHRKVVYFVFLGGTLAAVGFVATHSPPLFFEGLGLVFLGFAILIFCGIFYSYSFPYASRGRIRQGKVLTVGDAMILHVYYPSWMRDWTYGWIPVVPSGVFLLLGAVNLIPISGALFLFFVYGGSLMLYQYLYARRWVAKQRNKEIV